MLQVLLQVLLVLQEQIGALQDRIAVQDLTVLKKMIVLQELMHAAQERNAVQVRQEDIPMVG